MSEIPTRDPSLGRLAWRSRRGMKELDVMLQRWLAHCYPLASEQDRADFDAFLDLPDPELLDYLVRGEVPIHSRHARIAQQVQRAPR